MLHRLQAAPQGEEYSFQVTQFALPGSLACFCLFQAVVCPGVFFAAWFCALSERGCQLLLLNWQGWVLVTLVSFRNFLKVTLGCLPSYKELPVEQALSISEDTITQQL